MSDQARHFAAPYPLYPLALALYPGLALASANDDWLAVGALLPALVGPVLIALAVQRLLGRWFDHQAQAGAALAVALLLFFSYGHASMEIGQWMDPFAWLPVVWLALLLVGVRAVVRHGKAVARATKGLNLVGLVLLIMPIVNLAAGLSAREVQDTDLTPPELSLEPAQRATAAEPDVYFIVLDGYARADTLLRIYGHDNRAFLSELQQAGFHVDPDSFANYDQTILSMPATLNLDYLQAMEGFHETQFDFTVLVEMTRENLATRLLRGAGYEVVAFESEHPATRFQHPDRYLQLPPSEATAGPAAADGPINLTGADRLFLETTALRPVLRIYDRARPESQLIGERRQRIEFTLTHLDLAAREPGAQFTFAHVMAPHPPFVFQAEGRPRRYDGPYRIVDGSHWLGRIGTRAEYIERYRDQLIYVNELVLRAVEVILARSETSPIIVIQSDHGPGAYFDWNSQSASDLAERMGILTAVHLPPDSAPDVEPYRGMSPVNTLRLVLNAAVGADLEYLPDRAYFSTWESPFEFSEVTDEVFSP